MIERSKSYASQVVIKIAIGAVVWYFFKKGTTSAATEEKKLSEQ